MNTPIGLLLLLLTTTLLMIAQPASAFSERRLIVAFGESGSPVFERLAESVEASRCRLAEREVDVVFIDTAELRAVDSGATDSPTVQRALAARSPDAPAFELVLIGKDGGVKARQGDPDALQAMLDLIDTMPQLSRSASGNPDSISFPAALRSRYDR